MTEHIECIPEDPRAHGTAAGKEMDRAGICEAIENRLGQELFRDTLNAMDRKELLSIALERLATPPDTTRYPELGELYPDRFDFLKGFAEGAGCSLAEAALHDYLKYRETIDGWHRSLNPFDDAEAVRSRPPSSHCSGVMMVGPDGVIGAHSMESVPPEPRPDGWRGGMHTPHGRFTRLEPVHPKPFVLKKPRTGYIAGFGVGNEKGVACLCGNSCSVWLDDPIEDTWPLNDVPLLRFAATAGELAELYRRYTLHNWGRASQIWADTAGDAVVIEKSFRRIGIRTVGESGVLWCTEGYWHDPQMHDFIRGRRLAYLEKAGMSPGADDMAYANDCAVRFTNIGRLCHLPLGRTMEHLNRVVTDHSTFPRAVCRHGGPDTAPYDETVTMECAAFNVTKNQSYSREWTPWETMPCEKPWTVTQYPRRPRICCEGSPPVAVRGR